MIRGEKKRKGDLTIMKKSVFLVTAMVLFSIVLAACSTSTSNATETPGAFGNDTQTGPSGLGTPSTGLGTPSGGTASTPAATQAATSEATTAATKPATTSAVKTPVATSATGGLGTTPEATSAIGEQVTTQPDAGRVKDLLKFSVQDQSGTKIGTVKTLVLNLDQGQCDYIVVSQGGLLGIGAKSIAVPCQLFQFPTASKLGTTGSTSSTAGSGTGSSAAATATPASGGLNSTPSTGGAASSTPAGNESENVENILILKVDKAALDNAPKFDTAVLPGLGQLAGDWDSPLRTYWQQYENGIGSTGTTGSTGASSTPAAGLSTPVAGNTLSTPVTGGTSSTPATGASSQATAAMKLQGVILADKALGMPITDESNNQVGDVQDIVLDTTNCKIMYVVIAYNAGTTGGSSLIPIPATVFQLSSDGNSLVIMNASTILSSAPHFDINQFPLTLTRDWDKDVKTYWLSHGGSNSTTP